MESMVRADEFYGVAESPSNFMKSGRVRKLIRKVKNMKENNLRRRKTLFNIAIVKDMKEKGFV